MEGKGLRQGLVLRVLLSALIAWVVIPRPTVADTPLVTPGATLVTVYTSSLYFEGPTWHPATGALYFTQLTGQMRIFRLVPPFTTSLWMDNTQAINGTYLSNNGRLLCAQGDTRNIVSYRIGANGPEDPIVLAHDATWKAPNDLCQSPAGSIYFTTPDFEQQLAGRVYRIAPAGSVTAVVTDMPVPNGIITSIDGGTLYVSDSSLKLWRSYPILPDGSVGSGSVFFNPTTPDTSDPDGMTIDELGNLYFCGRGGVWIVSPAGEQIEMIPVPQFCSNVTFGGDEGRTLYITGDQHVWSMDMQVRGAAWPSIPENNQPPTVDAGPDLGTCLPRRTLHLEATVTDDGLPDPPGQIVLTWSYVSGPGQPSFSDPSASQIDVTLPAIGTYVLRLRAFDGIRTATDDVQVTLAGPADFDADGDVDSTDVAAFVACITGPGGTIASVNCERMDLDMDDDIDSSDFGLVQRCLTGPNAPIDPNCLQ